MFEVVLVEFSFTIHFEIYNALFMEKILRCADWRKIWIGSPRSSRLGSRSRFEPHWAQTTKTTKRWWFWEEP